jgi:hypothetical protein
MTDPVSRENYTSRTYKELKALRLQIYNHWDNDFIYDDTDLQPLKEAARLLDVYEDEILLDLQNAYIDVGFERLSRVTEVYVKQLVSCKEFFEKQARTYESFKIEFSTVIQEKKYSAAYIADRRKATISDVIINFLEQVEELKNKVLQYLNSTNPKNKEEETIDIALPNTSNRLALLEFLGIIKHLQETYPGALLERKHNMQSLLAMILDISIEDRKSFDATVKHLLNRTDRSPLNNAALLKIKTQLIQVGIDI